MTNRVSYAPQDFQKKCLQAERDHETRKLLVLLDRVKKQIANRENSAPQVDVPKRPASAQPIDSAPVRLPMRPAPFER
jgi:hypothetical protein